nr:hypothetical protein [Oscillospiraceae bacterium]
MKEQFNEKSKVSENATEGESEFAYKTVLKTKQNRRTWSVVSLILAVLSIAFLYFSWVSLIFGSLAVAAAVVSRINLGYFDKLSLAGIIVGIFGIVFSVAGIIFGSLISSVF